LPRSGFGEASAVPVLLAAVLLLLTVASAQAAPGQFDPTFGKRGVVTTGIGESAGALAVGLQPDGKIVVAGAGNIHCGDPCQATFALARYKPSGSLDRSFGTAGVVTTRFAGDDGAQDLALQANGQIVAAGAAFDGASSSQFGLARYNSDGSLDAAFGVGGKLTTAVGDRSGANALAIQPDGKLVAAGFGSQGNSSVFALVRYDTDGSLDPSFGSGGVVTTAIGADSEATGVALQPDGKIILAGFSDGNFALTRYETNGSLDATFGAQGKVVTSFSSKTDVAYGVALQRDGEVVAVGEEGGFNPVGHPALARYESNGSLDPTFGQNGKVTEAGPGHAYAVALGPHGKIITAGMRYSGGLTNFSMARFNHDGSRDPKMADGRLAGRLGINASASDLVLEPDNKVIGVGSALERFAVVRYLSGSERCVVPKLKDKRLAKAKRSIRRTYCSLGSVRRTFSGKFARGRVISQRPKHGTRRPVGAKVRLVVSKGKRR